MPRKITPIDGAQLRALVQASNDRLNKIIKPARATKQQIVYSKARAR